jgi:hypothetical protein
VPNFCEHLFAAKFKGLQLLEERLEIWLSFGMGRDRSYAKVAVDADGRGRSKVDDTGT